MVGSVVEEKPAPTLSDAMRTVFRPGQNDEDFAKALTNLAVALTTAAAAHVFRAEDRSAFASAPTGAEAAADLASHATAHLAAHPTLSDPTEQGGVALVTIALPSGTGAALAVRLRNPSPSIRALAFERMVSLAHLSFISFRHPDMQQFQSLLSLIQSDASPEDLALRIRDFVDADSIALGWFTGDDLSRLALSNQPTATPRAALPEALETELREARDPTRRPETVFVAGQTDEAVVLKADRPRRHLHLLPLLPQAIASAHGAHALNRRGWTDRWVRRGAFLLLAVGLSLIPIPDARRVPGEVISTEARTVTAPLSGVVLQVDVSNGDAVVGGKSTLFRLDTDDILQELTGAQAEYSRVLLERETARGARDAAALRNAELEAEALRARIDLLENRQRRATALAPVDGVVSGEDLTQFVGATVRLGDPIMDVLDPSALALKLEVPDTLLNRIKDGETGVFRPDFAPGQTFDSTLEWVSPAQSARADVSVFAGRATLPNDTGTLRPGLRGVFIFERSFKPVYAVVWDALRNWVLLRLWL
ncbi:MAG: efflux RND transporter periplasmic adaptor subunit [Paracoccaceae bacterium]